MAEHCLHPVPCGNAHPCADHAGQRATEMLAAMTTNAEQPEQAMLFNDAQIANFRFQKERRDKTGGGYAVLVDVRQILATIDSLRASTVTPEAVAARVKCDNALAHRCDLRERITGAFEAALKSRRDTPQGAQQ